MSSRSKCDYCGEPLAGKPWVLLNRAIFGSGAAWGATSFHNDEGDYVWEINDDGCMNETAASGRVLHFPGCMQTFIEGRMIEAEIEAS